MTGQHKTFPLRAERAGRVARYAPGGAGAPGENPIRHAPKPARATFPTRFAGGEGKNLGSRT